MHACVPWVRGEVIVLHDAHAESESYRRSNYRLICWWSTRVEAKGAEKHFTWFSLGNEFIVRVLLLVGTKTGVRWGRWYEVSYYVHRESDN